MIKFFIRAFLLLLSVVAVFVAIGYLLPRDYDIESTIYIESPPDEVFGYVNSLPNWQFWSNFSEQQVESLKITYCLLYTSPSPRDRTRSRMPSSA